MLILSPSRFENLESLDLTLSCLLPWTLWRTEGPVEIDFLREGAILMLLTVEMRLRTSAVPGGDLDLTLSLR